MKCAITAVKKYYSMPPVNRNLYSISSSRLSTPFVRAYTTVNTPSKISSALSDHASTFNFDRAEWTPRFDWRQRRASSKHKQDPVSSKRNKKGFTRRVNPPHMPVEIYQPFYEQIEQYTKQSVLPQCFSIFSFTNLSVSCLCWKQSKRKMRLR